MPNILEAVGRPCFVPIWYAGLSFWIDVHIAHRGHFAAGLMATSPYRHFLCWSLPSLGARSDVELGGFCGMDAHVVPPGAFFF